jgi:dCMP deaminase
MFIQNLKAFLAKEKVITWEEYFISIALVSAQRSKDPSRKVGCCLVGEDNKILSIGYNGFPRGCEDDSLPWDKTGAWYDTKYPYVCHAEANAILNSKSSLKNASAYVTLFPCN